MFRRNVGSPLPSNGILSCRAVKTSELATLYCKGKAVPLQAWSGPEGSRKLRFPNFMTTDQDGGKVVSLTHWPPLAPGNTLGTRWRRMLRTPWTDRRTNASIIDEVKPKCTLSLHKIELVCAGLN